MSSSIVVEFEVLPDDAPGPSDRNPQQVFNDLQRQLADPTSQLRRGDFGGFASVACLSGPGLPGFEPVGSEKGSERPSEPAGSARSIHGYPQQASVFEAATAPDLSGRLSAVPAAAQYGSSTELQGLSNADLVDRVSQLERQLQRTAAGGRQEGLPPLSSRRATIAGEATDDRCQQLQHRLEAVERELREANEAVRMWRQRHEQCELKLKDREQLLVHAKEMWMKENVRASKLADALTAAEDKLAEQDKRLGEVAERYNDAQREVRTLQHLVGDTNGDGLVAETLGVKKMAEFSACPRSFWLRLRDHCQRRALSITPLARKIHRERCRRHRLDPCLHRIWNWRDLWRPCRWTLKQTLSALGDCVC